MYENASGPRVGSRVSAPFDKSLKAHDSLAVYMVCDVSESMWHERFSSSWGGLASPYELMVDNFSLMAAQLVRDDTVRACAHLSVVCFADDVTEHLPLTHLSEEPAIRPFTRGTWTNYLAVWDYLAEAVPRDLQRLQQTTATYRPIIYFLTDGNPGSSTHIPTYAEWGRGREALANQLPPHLKPVIVSLGLGSVSSSTILKLHSTDPHGMACISTGKGESAKLIEPIVKSLKKSVSVSAAGRRFTFEIPAGMKSLCGGNCGR